MSLLTILAATIDIGTGPGKVNNVPTTSGTDLWANILNTAYFFAGVVAVFVIMYAGMRYILARGKEENITKAKNTILYAISGLIVIILAAVITNFVLGKFSQ